MTPNERAVEMLGFAAAYIRKHCPEESIFYDEAECDGYCVADDCESAAEELALPSAQAEAHTCETCVRYSEQTDEVMDLAGNVREVTDRDCDLLSCLLPNEITFCGAWAAREGT